MTNDYLPVSCCQQLQQTNSTDLCTTENASPIGCETMLTELFYKNVTVFIQTGLIACMFQVSTTTKKDGQSSKIAFIIKMYVFVLIEFSFPIQVRYHYIDVLVVW